MITLVYACVANAVVSKHLPLALMYAQGPYSRVLVCHAMALEVLCSRVPPCLRK